MSREEVMRLGEVVQVGFMMIANVILLVSADSIIALVVCFIVAVASYIYLNNMVRKGPQKDKR